MYLIDGALAIDFVSIIGPYIPGRQIHVFVLPLKIWSAVDIPWPGRKLSAVARAGLGDISMHWLTCRHPTGFGPFCSMLPCF